MGVLVLKRTSDKLDAVLSSFVLLLSLAVTGIYLSRSDQQLVCVPKACQAKPASLDCARDWVYPTNKYTSLFLTYPDTNFHYLLLTLSAAFFLLLSQPLFYGSTLCTELFATFSSIWKLRTNDPICQDVEWRRKMQLILGQLKAGTALTQAYSLYQVVGLLLDGLGLLLTSLYTLHFLDFSLPSPYFRLTQTEDDTFTCHQPTRALLQWFGVVASLSLALKTLNRLLCIGFAAGIPGLFGRNMVLYCDEIKDKNEEKVFNIDSNPLTVLTHALVCLVQTALISPLLSLSNSLQFYSRTLADNKEAADVGGDVADVLEPHEPMVENNGTNGFATVLSEERRIRQLPLYKHNWSDLLFILDMLAGSMDTADLIVFVSKTDELVSELEEKKVDLTASKLDVATGKLTVFFTHTGIIEKLIDVELSTSGGLYVAGWLEGPTGRIEPEGQEASVTFAKIGMGTSYTLVSALYGRGRLLARLPNFSFSVPQEIKARHKKKYGLTVPLIAFTQGEGRPLSLNFDIGR